MPRACLRLSVLICKAGMLTSTSQDCCERKVMPGTDPAAPHKLQEEWLGKQMFPVCPGALEMDNGGEHKGNQCLLATSIALLADRDCGLESSVITDLRVTLGKRGLVYPRPHWQSLGERHGEGRAEKHCAKVGWGGMEGR